MKTTTKVDNLDKITKVSKVSKVSKVIKKQDPTKTHYIIYSKEPPKRFNGIIGAIDVHCTHLLLSGGKDIIEETVPKDKDPIKWYIELLKGQDIHINNSSIDKNGTVWLEVDTSKSPIEEFASWRELNPNSSTHSDEIAWKSYWIPCKADTTEECIGFWVSAKEEYLTTTLSVASVLKTIMNAS
jgi:hypothetical protein